MRDNDDKRSHSRSPAAHNGVESHGSNPLQRKSCSASPQRTDDNIEQSNRVNQSDGSSVP